MSIFKIKGRNKLKGEIIPQGAKNEALQIVSAVLLTDQPMTIHNIPDIRDVNKLIELVGDLGAKVEKLSKDSYRFTASTVNTKFLESDEYPTKAAALRGSVMLLGPILARFGKASLPKPGGDKIGRRRLDTHFFGFQKLGAKFNFDSDNQYFEIDASKRAKADAYPNLTVKKIPRQVLSRCEWGHDDYSLQVENLPKEPPKPGQQTLFEEEI